MAFAPSSVDCVADLQGKDESVLNRILIFSLLCFAAILLTGPMAARPAHAQLKGLVCIDPALAQNVAPTGCSSAPVVLGGTGFGVGSKFTLEVDLDGSDIMSGFEVAVVTDTTVLNPVSANASGSATLINTLGGSAFPVVNCINGAGTSCVTGIDGTGVAHLAVISLGGLSTAPTTGRLMYVTYQVIGLSTGSPISYVVTTPQGTGACAGSSNSTAAGDTCVFIANGGGRFDPENVQTATATFSNQAPLDNTSTAVACSPSTLALGQTGTCTVTVTDTTNPSDTPTGSVSFSSSNTAVLTVGPSCALSIGSCSVTFTAVAKFGTDTVTATYGGDATHSGSTGTSNPINLVQEFAITVVACSPSRIDIGGASICTATVTDIAIPSNTPTGTVTFSVSNSTVGTLSPSSCTLSAGSCTVTFTGVALGTAIVTGTYGGDSTHNASSGTSNTITVGKDSTTTSVANVSCNIPLGGISCSATINATVTDTTTASNTPTGAVNFTLTFTGGSLSSTTCTLSGGSCSVIFTSSTACNTGLVTASYGGDSTHNGSTSTATITSVCLAKDNTSTSVACSPSAVVLGGTGTCTVTVSDTTTPSNTPTGSVTFTSSNPSVLTIGLSCISSGGSCSVTFTVVAPGIATVTGTYGGDSTHFASSGTSGAIGVIDFFTATSVSCSPSTVTLGQTGTCTLTVTDTTNPSDTPTGSVSFTSSNTAVITVGPSCTLSGGSCTVTFTGVAPGTATVTGTYGGDSTHNGSTGISNTIIVVAGLPPVTAVACTPSSILISGASNCTATVTDTTNPFNTPTGTVTFTVYNSTVGTLNPTRCTLSVGSCSVAFTGVAPGTATVTATYDGDLTHNGSSGTSNTITVTPRTTSTAISCTSSVLASSPASCTVTIRDTSPGTFVTPTGTVSLSTNSTGTFSGTCTLSGATASATCTLTYTPSGMNVPRTDTVTANYPGDTVHSGSVGSTAIIVTIPPPTFVRASLSWTHHLSLSKTSGVQSFTAHVEDFASIPVYVRVVVTGIYDNGLPFSAMSAITLLHPGEVTVITFTASVPINAIGFKIQFTATLPWGATSALGQPSASSKSGAFAVVA